jgi:hypothetical protein
MLMIFEELHKNMSSNEFHLGHQLPPPLALAFPFLFFPIPPSAVAMDSSY